MGQQELGGRALTAGRECQARHAKQRRPSGVDERTDAARCGACLPRVLRVARAVGSGIRSLGGASGAGLVGCGTGAGQRAAAAVSSAADWLARVLAGGAAGWAARAAARGSRDAC